MDQKKSNPAEERISEAVVNRNRSQKRKAVALSERLVPNGMLRERNCVKVRQSSIQDDFFFEFSAIFKSYFNA